MDGEVVIGTKLDTKDFTRQIEDTEKKLEGLQASLKKAKPGDNIREMRLEIEKTQNKLVDLYKKQSQIGKADYSQLIKTMDNVKDRTKQIIRNIVRWGTAIFGIRSAYNLLRNSMSTLMQYDEQLAADVQYIKNAIAFALEPVIRTIVDLVKQIMIYVGYIIQQWTGKNIFENANKSLKSANKQATKLQKTLAGFDEMNILQDNSGGGKGDVMPSFDLSSPENVEPPGWLTWIVQNKDGILALLGGIAGFIGAINLGLGGIKALGIGVIISGVILLIEKLIKYFNKLDGSIKDNGTSWEDFGGILKGVSLILLGVGILTGNVYFALAGLVLLIVSIIMENWTKIKEWWNNDVQPKIDGALGWLEENFGYLGKFISGTLQNIGNFIRDHFASILVPIKNVFDGVLLFIKGDWQNGLREVIRGLLNWIIGRINKIIDIFNLVFTPITATISVVHSALTGKNVPIKNAQIPTIPYMAKGGIINLPGRGVPIGGAIAGERGREGVLPLEDKEQMEILGEAIGKYITINASITNTMNGKVISRELQKINNVSDFAYNR